MSLRIGLVAVTHSRPDLCANMLRSAMESVKDRGTTIRFDVHNWSGVNMPRLDGIDMQEMGRENQNRRGIAHAWNQGIGRLYGPDYNCDAVIITNDDILFGPGDLENLASETAKHTPQHWAVGERSSCLYSGVHVVTCRGIQNRTSDGKVNPHEDTIHYSCFGITKAGWAELGAFDENFFPAYFEDCDYSYRAKLAGMREVNIGMTDIIHLGSQTANPDDPAVYSRELHEQNNRTFAANKAYYSRKWGGLNDHEVFTTPFNLFGAWGLHAGKPWYIDPSRSSTPYGFPYDRGEAERKGLVKL